MNKCMYQGLLFLATAVLLASCDPPHNVYPEADILVFSTLVKNRNIVILHDICELPDSSLIGVGYSDSLTNGESKPLIAQLSPTGTTLWKKTFATSTVELFRFVTFNERTGDLLVFGESANQSYFITMSTKGEWMSSTQISFGGAGVSATDLLPRENGDVVVCGFTKTNPEKGVIARCDPVGNILWSTILPNDTGAVTYNVRCTDVDTRTKDLVVSATYDAVQPPVELPHSVVYGLDEETGDITHVTQIPFKGARVACLTSHERDDIIIGGTVNNASTGLDDCLVARFRSNGDTLWRSDFINTRLGDYSQFEPVRMMKKYATSEWSQALIAGQIGTQVYQAEILGSNVPLVSVLFSPKSLVNNLKPGTFTGHRVAVGAGSIVYASKGIIQESQGYVVRK